MGKDCYETVMNVVAEIDSRICGNKAMYGNYSRNEERTESLKELCYLIDRLGEENDESGIEASADANDKILSISMYCEVFTIDRETKKMFCRLLNLIDGISFEKSDREGDVLQVEFRINGLWERV